MRRESVFPPYNAIDFPEFILKHIRLTNKPVKTFLNSNKDRLLRILCISLLLCAVSRPALGYVGPGAGFALATSFMALFVTIVVVFFVLAALPVRLFLRAVGLGVKRPKGKVRRVVIVGLDGLDPRIATEMMDAGEMPHFKKIAERGHFGPLRTTCPSVSPVAWSTFATGVNPGRHNIFDFLAWDWNTYLPVLSSTEVAQSAKVLKLGPVAMPTGRADIRLLRKSDTFWDVAARRGVPSMVLRVPITYPPNKSPAMTLSGMCAPDLRGSQGSFTYFTTDESETGAATGGERRMFERSNGRAMAALPGPPDPLSDNGDAALEVRLTLKPLNGGKHAMLRIPGSQPVKLAVGEFSEWTRVPFRAAAGLKVHGLCRFLLRELEPHIRMYVTPINIDPERPALPVGNPTYFSVYLAKSLGAYATLGLAEDTWAVNEKVITFDDFHKQVYMNHGEREAMLDLALDRVRSGLVVCVFDTPDRVQHMFWRQHEQGHGEHADTLRDMYRRMDALVGRVAARLGRDDVLMVMSDHGVRGFRRCFHVNAWLAENGYLKLKSGAEEDYYQSVDWSGTRAFGVGLSGLCLNVKGRGDRGTVAPEEAEALKAELIEKLLATVDPDTGTAPLKQVFEATKIYDGPYAKDAPDLLLCYDDGYRTAWESVTGGGMSGPVFCDNDRAWSGDHCAHPSLVPGSLLCDRLINVDSPHIGDMGPTALDLLGVTAPQHMQGQNIL